MKTRAHETENTIGAAQWFAAERCCRGSAKKGLDYPGAQYALKFAKKALAYMVELGSDGPAGSVPADKTEKFSGKLTLGQKQSDGSFKVAAGARFSAVLSGRGDAGLYLRKGSAPTTRHCQ